MIWLSIVWIAIFSGWPHDIDGLGGTLTYLFIWKWLNFLMKKMSVYSNIFILLDKCYTLVESEHLPLRKNESKNIIPLIRLNLEFHSESTWENSPVQVNCPILTSPQHIVRLWDEYTSCRKLPVTHTFSSFFTSSNTVMTRSSICLSSCPKMA